MSDEPPRKDTARKLSKLAPGDPKSCLPDAARIRIQDAHIAGEAIRAKAVGKVLTRYTTAPEPRGTLEHYRDAGEGAVKLREANLKYARVVLDVTAREFWTFGKSPNEIRELMRDEIEGAIRSLGLSDYRDLLEIELTQLLNRLGAEESDTSAPAPAVPPPPPMLPVPDPPAPQGGRSPSSISSPSAARRMEQYVKAKALSWKDFASRVDTTERTLRSFRSTGKVRRVVFVSIAKQMDLTAEDFLKS